MTALLVRCRSCRREYSSDELRKMACLDCQVRETTAEVRADITRQLNRAVRYRRTGGRFNPEILDRLRSRLLRRILELVTDPRKALELADREYQAAISGMPGAKLLPSRLEVARLSGLASQ